MVGIAWIFGHRGRRGGWCWVDGLVVVVSRRGVIFLWTIVFLEFDFPRWDRRLGLLAEDGFTGFVGIECGCKLAGAPAKGADGVDEGWEKLRPGMEKVEGAAVVELDDDLAQLVGRKSNGALLDLIDVDGADAMLDGSSKDGLSFEFVLAIEPVDIAMVFPKGDVSGCDTGMAKIVEVRDDVIVAEAAAEHAIDDLADI